MASSLLPRSDKDKGVLLVQWLDRKGVFFWARREGPPVIGG
jgi:hypothetical protein